MRRLVAMARALKVFRTSIGFDDAYVAAPSRAAALRAWGSTRDLFATGAAEQVTDPAHMEEPLAQPGVVIRRSRGTLKDQLAALGPVPARVSRRAPAATPAPGGAAAGSRKPAMPAPKPSRVAVLKAEQAIASYEQRAAAEIAALRRREAALARERAQLTETQRKELDRLEMLRANAEGDYRAQMTEWAKASR